MLPTTGNVTNAASFLACAGRVFFAGGHQLLVQQLNSIERFSFAAFRQCVLRIRLPWQLVAISSMLFLMKFNGTGEIERDWWSWVKMNVRGNNLSNVLFCQSNCLDFGKF